MELGKKQSSKIDIHESAVSRNKGDDLNAMVVNMPVPDIDQGDMLEPKQTPISENGQGDRLESKRTPITENGQGDRLDPKQTPIPENETDYHE